MAKFGFFSQQQFDQMTNGLYPRKTLPVYETVDGREVMVTQVGSGETDEDARTRLGNWDDYNSLGEVVRHVRMVHV